MSYHNVEAKYFIYLLEIDIFRDSWKVMLGLLVCDVLAFGCSDDA